MSSTPTKPNCYAKYSPFSCLARDMAIAKVMPLRPEVETLVMDHLRPMLAVASIERKYRRAVALMV